MIRMDGASVIHSEGAENKKPQKWVLVFQKFSDFALHSNILRVSLSGGLRWNPGAGIVTEL